MPSQVDVDEEELTRLCGRHGIRRLAFFGSVLRDGFQEDSDVDILMSFEPDTRIGLIRLARIQRELSELLGRPVDLVPEDSLKPALRSDILSCAETPYAS